MMNINYYHNYTFTSDFNLFEKEIAHKKILTKKGIYLYTLQGRNLIKILMR